MKALGESELALLEWRMKSCSTGKWSGQGWRAVGGGGVYIGFSQESSRWTKIQNSDKVRGEPGNVRLGLSVNWGLSRVGPDLFVDGFEKDLKLLDSIIFTSSNTSVLIVRCSYTQEI
jgi:hypothetical protein